MIPSRRIPRPGAGILAPLLAFLAFSCGSVGTDFAGGGTGGTGISTGSIAGFGSVVVNGVHFKTDADVGPGFRTKKVVDGLEDRSGRPDKEVFAAGMVVTVRHGAADNNASEIGYRNNLLGPVAEKVPGPDNVVLVLGHAVVVEDAQAFGTLGQWDIVEVSGFADDAGRLRATYVSRPSRPANRFEAKGYVSGLSGNTFRLGPLPDGQGATVGVSYKDAAVSDLPGGLGNGMYVQVVTTDREPVGGTLGASRIETVPARTDFPENAAVVLEGLVTAGWTGSETDLSLELEGKRVEWYGATEFAGGGRDDARQANRKVQVQGTETGGVLSAARIVFR